MQRALWLGEKSAVLLSLWVHLTHQEESVPGSDRPLHTPVLPSSTLPEPVSQLHANLDLILHKDNSGPTAELSCLASSGSPPITYRLVGSNGRVLAQQRPLHGKPASFSLPLSQTSDWFQCEAENNISVDRSARVLLPPGEQVLSSLEQGVIRWSGLGNS